MGLGDFRNSLVETLLEDAGAPFDPALERRVQDFVAEGIRGMPAHLRVGVESVGVLLSAVIVAQHRVPFSRLGPDARRAAIRIWDQTTIDPIRQYLRLVRSLVLFSAHEWTAGASVA